MGDSHESPEPHIYKENMDFFKVSDYSRERPEKNLCKIINIFIRYRRFSRMAVNQKQNF